MARGIGFWLTEQEIEGDDARPRNRQLPHNGCKVVAAPGPAPQCSNTLIVSFRQASLTFQTSSVRPDSSVDPTSVTGSAYSRPMRREVRLRSRYGSSRGHLSSPGRCGWYAQIVGGDSGHNAFTACVCVPQTSQGLSRPKTEI